MHLNYERYLHSERCIFEHRILILVVWNNIFFYSRAKCVVQWAEKDKYYYTYNSKTLNKILINNEKIYGCHTHINTSREKKHWLWTMSFKNNCLLYITFVVKFASPSCMTNSCICYFWSVVTSTWFLIVEIYHNLDSGWMKITILNNFTF